MSCYFRHMREIFEEVGVEITEKNKKEVDSVIHRVVGVEYKNCSPTWAAVKEHIKKDVRARSRFVERLKKELKGLSWAPRG